MMCFLHSLYVLYSGYMYTLACCWNNDVGGESPPIWLFRLGLDVLESYLASHITSFDLSVADDIYQEA